MASKAKTLKKLAAGKVQIFKIKNRKGYAAVFNSNLTEGNTVLQAFARMAKAVKREGYNLSGNPPKPRK